MKEAGGVLIIDSNEVIKKDIIPLRREDLSRGVIVKPFAHVKGSIVGGRVELYPGCRVDGGIVASEIVFNTASLGPRHEASVSDEEKDLKIVINGDVVSFSSISTTETSGKATREKATICIKGNLIAEKHIGLTNSIIFGNVVSSSAELSNIVCLGALGLINFGDEDTDTHHKDELNTIFNSIVFTILSEKDITVGEEGIGIIMPLIYLSSGAKIKGNGVIAVINPKPFKNLLINLLSSKKAVSIESDIKDYLRNHHLYTLPIGELHGLVSFLSLEILPSIKRRRLEDLSTSIAEFLSMELSDWGLQES